MVNGLQKRMMLQTNPVGVGRDESCHGEGASSTEKNVDTIMPRVGDAHILHLVTVRAQVCVVFGVLWRGSATARYRPRGSFLLVRSGPYEPRLCNAPSTVSFGQGHLR